MRDSLLDDPLEPSGGPRDALYVVRAALSALFLHFDEPWWAPISAGW
jgi:hypothetical protein